jgi:iron(III) transport system substrate-binding protein
MGWVAVLGLASCTSSQKPEIWIYTSIYKDVITELEPLFEKAIPEAKIQWFQGGSEIIAAKVQAEMAAGSPKADLILTSDPFWYLELKQKNALLPYESPKTNGVPSEWKDSAHTFATVRLPVMILAHHAELKTPLTQWSDLTKSDFHEKVAMGSPLESGTFFTAVAVLSEKYGWDFFKTLRQRNILAAGGNSSVLNRIETQERPAGILLLENFLKAKSKKSPVQAVYPTDGVIPIPSPIAILKTTRSPELSRKIYDFFFEEEVQRKIVASGMYSPLPSLPAPDGAKPWSELKPQALPVGMAQLDALFAKREEIKKRFSETVLQ